MSNFYKLINEKTEEKGTDVSMEQLKAVVQLFKEIGIEFVEKKYKFTLDEFVDGIADEIEEHGDEAGKNDTISNVNGHDNPVLGGKTDLVHLIKSSKYYTELHKMEKRMPK